MKIIEYYEDDEFLMIVEELYHGGELLDRIIELKNFSEEAAAMIMRQVLSGIHYCHQRKIVHRLLLVAF